MMNLDTLKDLTFLSYHGSIKMVNIGIYKMEWMVSEFSVMMGTKHAKD